MFEEEVKEKIEFLIDRRNELESFTAKSIPILERIEKLNDDIIRLEHGEIGILYEDDLL